MDRSLLLDVQHLKTAFPSKEGELFAVNDVSLQLQPGEILGLVGESGSGKSVTGFSLMNLIDKPGKVVNGSVYFKGQDLLTLPEKAMRSLRGNRIAMIFQDPMMTLNPVLRIDVQMIETLQAHKKINYKAARARAEEALALMGVPSPKERLQSYPYQLSGGMRQRVAIAIALLLQPDLIIADEPTTALDVTIQAQILSEVQKLAHNYGTALIWITHDLSVVAGLADRIAVMYAGKIVESGSSEAVLTHPQHPYTQGLINSLPSHNIRGERLTQINGITPNLADLPSGCAFAPRCERATEQCHTQPHLIPISEDNSDIPHQVSCFFPSHSVGKRQIRQPITSSTASSTTIAEEPTL